MIKDILREMRGPFYKVGRSNARLDKATMKAMSSFADRIEKADNARRDTQMFKHLEFRVMTKRHECSDYEQVGAPLEHLEDARRAVALRKRFGAYGYGHRIEAREVGEWKTFGEHETIEEKGVLDGRYQ